MIELLLEGNQGKISTDSLTLNLIRDHLSMANPAYRRNIPYIQSRLYAITPSGKFDVGLLGEIIQLLNQNSYNYNIHDDLKIKYYCGFKDIFIYKLKYDYRDYQEESIKNAIKQGRGITVIPTAGGKTLICAGLISSLRQTLKDENALAMVMVPSIQLVEQTASDFISYGMMNVTKWSGDNKPTEDADVIVAGTQLLLSEKTDLSILSNVKILIIDECHHLKAKNKINKILKFVKSDHKFGFTGTMPVPKIDQWNIIGKLGPITYEQKTLSLKNQEYISNFKIIILNVQHNQKPKTIKSSNPAASYENELDFIINNHYRNEIICKLANNLENNTLIMVDRINHGEIMENVLKNILNLSKTVYFIRGSTEMEDREYIRNLMNERSDIVIIAISKIFSTGINIPNLHNIIFASAGKAKIKIMQSIGRALRLHPTKTLAKIFDVSDNTKYSKLHLEERKLLYQSENYEYIEKTI